MVQGSAADLIKLAMIDLQAKIAGGDKGVPGGTQRTKMLLQIHDELVFECLHEQADAVRAMVVERMEHAMTLDVPLKVDSSIAQNWFDGK